MVGDRADRHPLQHLRGKRPRAQVVVRGEAGVVGCGTDMHLLGFALGNRACVLRGMDLLREVGLRPATQFI